MPSIDEPTLGEVLRRIDGLTTQVTALVSELKQDRVDAAKTYVRQDVYVAEKNMQNAVVSDLNGDIQALKTDHGRELKQFKIDRQNDADKRRQMWMTLIGLAITTVIGLAALILNIIQG